MSGMAQGALSGGFQGAALGSAFGPIGTAIGGIGGALAGGYLSRRGDESTPMQKKQTELVDQLLASLRGQGPFTDLFKSEDRGTPLADAYNRDAFMSKFQNQIAPQIQQSFIAGGQQRSSGLESALARAGVDLNQQMDETYLNLLSRDLDRNMQYDKNAQKTQQKALSQILGMGPGPRGEQSTGDALKQALAGYASSPQFGQNISDIIGSFNRPKIQAPASKGFTTEGIN